MSKLQLLITIIALCWGQAYAQIPEPENGVHTENQTIALMNAHIVVSADEVIERGTMVIKDGIIQQVGLAIIPPRDAVKIDMKGYTLYPSFIDMYATDGVEALTYKPVDKSPQLNSLKEGPYYWNQAIHPEVDAVTRYKKELFKSREKFIEQGFGAVATHSADGILRGTSVFLTIGDKKEAQVIRSQAANHYSFCCHYFCVLR